MTFWNHQGKPKPQVGKTVPGLVNYPLVDHQEKTIVPDKFLYSFWVREFDEDR